MTLRDQCREWLNRYLYPNDRPEESRDWHERIASSIKVLNLEKFIIYKMDETKKEIWAEGYKQGLDFGHWEADPNSSGRQNEPVNPYRKEI